nr:hypothetical protein [Trebonia kvetii]
MNGDPMEAVQQARAQVSYYDVNFALEGANGIETHEEQVVLSARRAGVISPQMMPTMHLSDGYGQLHVRIERSALERHLERVQAGLSQVRSGFGWRWT